MIARLSPPNYRRPIPHFIAARGLEISVLQAAPLLGLLFGNPGHDWTSVGRSALLVAGSVALTAHVFIFNDWAGQTSDVNDPRRATRVFGRGGISGRQVATLAMALLIVAMFLLAFIGPSAVLFGAMIAAFSLLYSGSASGKGRPIVSSLLHVLGGMFHFLLGYTVSHAVDVRGVAIGIFFGLVFAAGHLNQEVRDYEADLHNRIRTTAVVLSRRRAFILSLLGFTAAYLLLGALALVGVLPRLLIWGTIFWPWHVLFSMQALRNGLGFEAAIWMQRRYRLQFAVLGLAMLLTSAPVAELARRAHHPHHPPIIVLQPERT